MESSLFLTTFVNSYKVDTNLSPVAYLKPVDSFKDSLVLFFYLKL